MHNLKSNRANRKAKQVGRGGKRGKTSGKGTKGQNARAGRKKRPEMRDIIKRFPKLRGRGKNYLKSIKPGAVAVQLGVIDALFKAGEQVTVAALIEKGIVSVKNGNLPAVKIVGGGQLTKKVSFSGLNMSQSVKQSIEKAGAAIV